MKASELAEALAIVLRHAPNSEACIHSGRIWLDDPEGLTWEEHRRLDELGFTPGEDSISSERWSP